MALYQVFLESTHITYRQFGPINNVVFEDKRDRGNIFYRKSLVNDLIFGQKDDYLELFALTPYENEEVTVTIKVDCEGVLTEYWKGTFTIVDCKVNIDHCTIEVNPRPLDRYSCILSKLDTEVPLWDPDSGVVTVKLTNDSILYYEPKALTITVPTAGGPPLTLFGPYGAEWFLEEPIIVEDTFVVGPNTTYVNIYYHHFVGFGTDTVPPDRSGLWYKWKDTTDPGEPALPFAGAWRWVRYPNENAKGLAPLTQGKSFIGGIRHAILSLNCGINDLSTIFFYYNGLGTIPGNSPYSIYRVQNNQYLTLHQKSDVKRPYDTNRAEQKVWTCKLKDILEDLKTIFNVYWDIDDDDNLRLEHISFYTDQDIIDLTNKCKGEKLKYDYNDAESIQEDQYKMMDEASSRYFKGYPIKYLTANGDGNVRENKARIFSTDVYYIQDSSNAENVQDKGFVIVSNLNGGTTRDINKANTPLGWPILHEQLHRHNRPYQEFYLNDMLDSALFVVKKKQQEQFFVFMCCDQIKDTDDILQDYDPKKLITTNLGTGEIESARYDVTNDTLTLKLQY